jgi:hypothetical protein
MLQWLHTFVSGVSSVFIFMLQMFHLNVLKVDRVLHAAIRLLPLLHRRGSSDGA